MVALLDSHPRIAMTNEAAWVTFLRKAFLLSSTPAGRWVDDGENLRTPGILPERYTRAVAESFLTVMHPFVAELFRRVKDRADPAWFGDKVMSLPDLQFAIEWFPDAAFVQLVRDPRTCCSEARGVPVRQCHLHPPRRLCQLVPEPPPPRDRCHLFGAGLRGNR